MTNIESDQDSRWLKGDIAWNNENISLATVYAPNAVYSRVRYFKKILNHITNNQQWIVGDDFNCDIDIRDTSKIVMKAIIQEKDLIDIWRTVYPEKPGCTHLHKGLTKSSRIDYILMSPSLLNKIGEFHNNSTGLTRSSA